MITAKQLQVQLMQKNTLNEMIEEIGKHYNLDKRLVVFEKVTIAGFLSKVPQMLNLDKRL